MELTGKIRKERGLHTGSRSRSYAAPMGAGADRLAAGAEGDDRWPRSSHRLAHEIRLPIENQAVVPRARFVPKAGAPRGPERTPMPLRRETHVSPVSYLPRKIALALLLGVLLFLASSGPFAARQFPAMDEIADGPGTYDPGELEPLLP